ncbi:MAG: DUF3617 family protein [Sulfuricella sp.]|nr:DUF3617 family protein [Sulfuricella sp.]
MAKKCLAAWAGLIFLMAANAQAAPNLKEGLWEITGRLDMPGMPGMPAGMPPAKHTQCLSSKDAVPHKPEKEQDCKVASLKQDGDGVSWAIQCRSAEGVLESSGKVTYWGESMEGVMTMNVKDGTSKEVMKMAYRISGKRVGDCRP